MLHLAAPLYLLLFLLVPLLIWQRGRYKANALLFSDLRLFDGLPARASWLARHGAFTLRNAALCSLIIALSGPRWPDLRTRLDTEGIAVMLALDTSGSMSERDFDFGGEMISRLDAVRRVFPPFVAGGSLNGRRFDGRPTDLIGLLRFAGRPEVICPLTLQHETLLGMLDTLRPDPDPGTNLADAVTLGLARLHTAGPRRKLLVLLTDGEDNERRTRSGWSPLQTGTLAKSLGVVIYTIDAGPDSSQAARLLARQTLEELAEMTGGVYLPVKDTAALADACQRIDRLERSSIVSFQYRRYHEGYPWFGVTAFVFYVLAELLDRTLWRRVP
ncbi:MAG: VWA domain-containing protein [Planctomycetia bacterium]|nr:VWA domain-containing protein [Planctomycetia bacterium]